MRELKSLCGVWCVVGFVLTPSFAIATGTQKAATESAVETEGQPLDAEGTSDAEGPGRTVVSASASEESPLEVARSVFLVDGETLSLTPDLSAAASASPGVFLQRTNVGAGTPIIRGRAGIDNRMLIDGLRYENATFRTGPNQFLSVLDPYGFEQLEILLGPASTLYGSGSAGGVLHMRSRRRDDPTWARALGIARSADSSATMVFDGGGGQDGVGYLQVGGTLSSHSDLRAGAGEVQPLTAYDRRSFRFSGRSPIGDHYTFGVTGLHSRLDGAGRTDRLGLGEVRLYDNEDLFTYVDVMGHHSGNVENVRVAFLYHRTSETVERRNCQQDDDGSVLERAACVANSDLAVEKRRRNHDVVDTVGGVARVNMSLYGGTWEPRLGVELYHDMVSSRRLDSAPGSEWTTKERGNFSDGSTATEVGGYFMSDVSLHRTQSLEWKLMGGTRVSVQEAFAPDVPGVGDVDYRHAGLTGQAGTNLLIDGRANVYANYANGFRGPNLQETTVVGATGSFFEVPNSDLEPEQTHTFELGTRLKESWLSLSVSGHYSLIEDVIVREPTTFDGQDEIEGAKVRHRVNADSATLYGVESGLELGPYSDLSVFGTFAWTHGESESDGKVVPLRRSPPLHGRAGVKFSPDQMQVRIYSVFAGAQDRLHPDDQEDLRTCEDPLRPGNVLENCSGTPGWATVNMDFSIAPSEGWRINAGIENLTDKRYRPHGSGFFAPGANAWVSVESSY